jgi:hypothetical protein
MFLKNYTSNVPVSDTIYRIEQVLLRCGVTAIAKEYSPVVSGKITALVFTVDFGDGAGRVNIRLPADEKAAVDALFKDYAGNDSISANGQTVNSSYKKKSRRDFIQQGERTAWKIMQDWVEVQMSMIQMKQAELREVFLAYVWDGRRTYFQALKEHGFKGLLENNSNDHETSGQPAPR